MVISPIINGFACFTFFLFYQAWKYAFTWQIDQSPASETGGLFFPKAIQHVFVGMYVQQVCLAALFFLARNENGRPSALPMGILMAVLIFFTVCGIFKYLVPARYR
jgi:calcium permeable stress-gated cation channel